MLTIDRGYFWGAICGSIATGCVFACQRGFYVDAMIGGFGLIFVFTTFLINGISEAQISELANIKADFCLERMTQEDLDIVSFTVADNDGFASWNRRFRGK